MERLRAYAKDQGGWHNIDETCEAAADYIEAQDRKIAETDRLNGELGRSAARDVLTIAALIRERDEARAALAGIRRRVIFGPGLTSGDLLDMTASVAPSKDEPIIDRERDVTNPFVPLEKHGEYK